MQPHQERVVAEKSELDVRIGKLSSFLGTTLYQSLPADEQDRLSRQFSLMRGYSDVLGERIDNFVE